MAGTNRSLWNTQTKVFYVRTQFFKSINVSLKIMLLPANVTKEEIEELVSDLSLSNIEITKGPTYNSAVADVDNVEELEKWDWDKIHFLHEEKISVEFYVKNPLLCVTKLPLEYTEEEFYNLVKPYGEIQSDYLMVSETTGYYKGYGFVQYKVLTDAQQANVALNKVYINNYKIKCEFLNDNLVTFKSLHSKCLYVDCIPKNVSAVNEVQKLFSTLNTRPVYCQVAIKHGCVQDWGIVEYNNWEDAERVKRFLDGYRIQSTNIKISYYIPGERAVHAYAKLMGDNIQTENSLGLLPEPSYEEALQRILKLLGGNLNHGKSVILIIVDELRNRGIAFDEEALENLRKDVLSNSNSQNNELPLINNVNSVIKDHNISSQNIMMTLPSNPVKTYPNVPLGHNTVGFPLASTPSTATPNFFENKTMYSPTLNNHRNQFFTHNPPPPIPSWVNSVSSTPKIFENSTMDSSPTLNNRRQTFIPIAPPLILFPWANSMNRIMKRKKNASFIHPYNQKVQNNFHATQIHSYKNGWVSTDARFWSVLNKCTGAQTPMLSDSKNLRGSGPFYSSYQKQQNHLNSEYQHSFYTHTNEPKINPIGPQNISHHNSEYSFEHPAGVLSFSIKQTNEVIYSTVSAPPSEVYKHTQSDSPSPQAAEEAPYTLTVL